MFRVLLPDHFLMLIHRKLHILFFQNTPYPFNFVPGGGIEPPQKTVRDFSYLCEIKSLALWEHHFVSLFTLIRRLPSLTAVAKPLQII